MEKKSLCMRCMNDTCGYNVCMHCGYENGSVNPEPSHIKPGTHIANGRYLIGAAVRTTRTELWYAGYDENLGKRVIVREFFPNGTVSRGEDSMRVCTDGPKREGEFTESASRYRLQMRAVASIRNDNVVYIDDVFEENGTVYAVTEYLGGVSLSDYVKSAQRQLSVQELREAALQMCSAVKALHAAGFIHCGIGLESISVCENNTFKLSEFYGTVRIGGSAVKGIKYERGVTAPEIFDERAKPTPQTDVYSIAAVLYRLASGKLPEDARDRTLHDEQLPLTGRCSLPDGMCRAIDKALSLEPGKRYRSVYLFENALKTEERQTAAVSAGTHTAQQRTTVELPAPNVSEERRITQRESINPENVATTVAVRSTPRKRNQSALLAVPITAVILIIAIGITLIAMSLVQITNTITCYGLDPDSNEEASVICDELQIKLAQTPDKADVSIGEMPFPSALKISEYSIGLESALEETFSADGLADEAKLSLIKSYINKNPDDFGLPLAYSPYVIFVKDADGPTSAAQKLNELVDDLSNETETPDESGTVAKIKSETAPTMYEDKSCKNKTERVAAPGDRVLIYKENNVKEENNVVRIRWAGEDVYVKDKDSFEEDADYSEPVSVSKFDEISGEFDEISGEVEPDADTTAGRWYKVSGEKAYFRKYPNHGSVLLKKEPIEQGSYVYVYKAYKEIATERVLYECSTDDGVKGYLLKNDIGEAVPDKTDPPLEAKDIKSDSVEFAVIGDAEWAIDYIYGDGTTEKLEKAGKIKYFEEYGKDDLKDFKYVISSANLYGKILDAVEKLDTRSKPYPAKVTERVYISSDTRKSAKLKQACEFIAKLLSCYATEENAKNCIFSVTDTKLEPNCGDEDVNKVIREIIKDKKYLYLLGEKNGRSDNGKDIPMH